MDTEEKRNILETGLFMGYTVLSGYKFKNNYLFIKKN
jgi:hypothetical protein